MVTAFEQIEQMLLKLGRTYVALEKAGCHSFHVRAQGLVERFHVHIYHHRQYYFYY
jgi:hypothetical protein